MVLSSNGKTVLWSVLSLETTLLLLVSQAQSLALPNGGAPSSVGKYFSTSGNSKEGVFHRSFLGSPLT